MESEPQIHFFCRFNDFKGLKTEAVAHAKAVLDGRAYIWRRFMYVCDVGVSSLTKRGAQLECVSVGGLACSLLLQMQASV